MTDALAQWIREVHASLAPKTVERQSAAWGPVTMRHRTTATEWFGPMDLAWAVPIERGHDIDVITARIDDVPQGIDPPPLRHSQLGPRGEAPVPPGGATRLTWLDFNGQILGWDPETGVAILLTAAAPDGYDLVSPMRTLVHWAVVAAGGTLVHGAAVGRGGRTSVVGVLLLGNAGHGKSTTTLGCLGHGWVTAGDDAVAVFSEPRGWHACAIYGAVKTKLDSAPPPDLPETAAGTRSWDVAGTKRAHLLTATDDETLVPRVDLAALVLLDPAANPQDPISDVPAGTIRTRGAPSTLLSLPFDQAPVLERFGDLAAALPGYRLPRRATIAATVADVERIAEDSQPTVSVVIPVYNGRQFVRDAIRSILDQTIGRFQIIIVNDASPDDSLEVAERLRREIESCGHALDTVDLADNQGVAGARNAGLERARGDYVAWLDQDDLWPPARTAILWSALRSSGAQIAQGRMVFRELTPHVRRTWQREAWFEGDHPGYVLGALLCTRDAVDRVGPLNPSYSTGFDDVDWFLRARALDIPTEQVPEVCVERRLHETNQSASASQAELLAAVRTHVHRNRKPGS